MNIYDLPKDMLVKLISTIRSETIKEYDEKFKSLIPTIGEAEQLFTSAKPNLFSKYGEGEDAFLILNNEDRDKIPLVNDDWSMFSNDIMSNILELKRFFLSKGNIVILLMNNYNINEINEVYVVLTDYSRKHYMDNLSNGKMFY